VKAGAFPSLRLVVAVCAVLAAVGLSGCTTTTACPGPCQDRLIVTFPGLDLSKKPTASAWQGVFQYCNPEVALDVPSPTGLRCDAPAKGELGVELGYLDVPIVVTVRVRFADGTTVTRKFDVDLGGPMNNTSECTTPGCRVVRKTFEL
jgi:hypothetical protein